MYKKYENLYEKIPVISKMSTETNIRKALDTTEISDIQKF